MENEREGKRFTQSHTRVRVVVAPHVVLGKQEKRKGEIEYKRIE